MKKFLIVVLSIFCFSNAFAEDYETQDFSKFNQWLLENGYFQYLKGEGGKFDICSLYKKNSDAWLNEECGNYPEGKIRLLNNLKIKTYGGRWAIPSKKDPNRDTLIYYNYKNLFSHFNGDSNTYQFGRYEVKPSDKHYEFKSSAKENKFVQKEMKKKALLSYLYFQDGQILIDELTPKDRFGDFVKNETKLRSNSVGKSMVSVVLGNAICEGYIESLDSEINDWPMLKNTLYENQKITDFLNMNVGDYKHINDWGPTKDYSYDVDTESIKTTMDTFFRNTEKETKPKYNYTQLVPNIIFNYVKHKTGDDFQNLLDKSFQKAGIKNSVYFNKLRDHADYGNAHNMFFASRYDYLRIAKSIMDDYQNDTCLGKYYKEVYKRRIKKKNKGTDHDDPPFSPGTSYGGFFHMDYAALKDKVIFDMSGYGGQKVVIDPENSRIVVLNSIHWSNKKYKYNVKKLLIEPFKDKK